MLDEATPFRVSTGASVRTLIDGRLHLSHGPIDLIVMAEGAADEVDRAFGQAVAGFDGVLERLVDELPLLRSDAREAAGPEGPVARRMARAVSCHRDIFITPMAAVAGAVADHILSAMLSGRAVRRAHVNNGGDIALWLGPGETCRVAVATDPVSGAQAARLILRAEDGIGGIATSGWRGRSHSLGIADAVTVLATDAAMADAAATLIANAVDLPHEPRISREPARSLSPQSDLGERMVTTFVPPLEGEAVSAALAAGHEFARAQLDLGHIRAAFLTLQGRSVTVGDGPRLLED